MGTEKNRPLKTSAKKNMGKKIFTILRWNFLFI